MVQMSPLQNSGSANVIASKGGTFKNLRIDQRVSNGIKALTAKTLVSILVSCPSASVMRTQHSSYLQDVPQQTTKHARALTLGSLLFRSMRHVLLLQITQLQVCGCRSTRQTVAELFKPYGKQSPKLMMRATIIVSMVIITSQLYITIIFFKNLLLF